MDQKTFISLFSDVKDDGISGIYAVYLIYIVMDTVWSSSEWACNGFLGQFFHNVCQVPTPPAHHDQSGYLIHDKESVSDKL